jgi:hypothetical protein
MSQDRLGNECLTRSPELKTADRAYIQNMLDTISKMQPASSAPLQNSGTPSSHTECDSFNPDPARSVTYTLNH